MLGGGYDCAVRKIAAQVVAQTNTSRYIYIYTRYLIPRVKIKYLKIDRVAAKHGLFFPHSADHPGEYSLEDSRRSLDRNLIPPTYLCQRRGMTPTLTGQHAGFPAGAPGVQPGAPVLHRRVHRATGMADEHPHVRLQSLRSELRHRRRNQIRRLRLHLHDQPGRLVRRSGYNILSFKPKAVNKLPSVSSFLRMLSFLGPQRIE